MYKAIRDGVIKVGRKLPPLTEEDRETIRKMFEEFSQPTLVKEAGIWKSIEEFRADRM